MHIAGPLSSDSEVVEPQATLQLRSATRTSQLIAIGGVVGLTVLALYVRRHNLAPSTLTHDDAWVAYIYRVGFADSVVVGLTSPGFVFLEKLWLSIVGFSELKAQIPTLVAGVVASAVAFVVLRPRVRLPFALLAGALIAFAPIGVIYSSAAKQYTTEIVIGLLLMLCGFRLIEQPEDQKRWAQFAALTVIAVIVSFMLAVVAFGAAVAGLLAAARSGRPSFLKGLYWMVPVAGLIAFWYYGVIGPRIPGGLRHLWGTYAGGEGRYIATDAGVGGWVESLWDRLINVLEWMTRFDPVLVGIVGCLLFLMLAIRRPLVFTMTALPLGVVIVFASLELAPLGGNRTDMWLQAPLIVGAICGLDAVADAVESGVMRIGGHSRAVAASRIALASAVLIAVAIGGRAALRHQSPPPYVLQDVRPLIAQLEDERTVDDVVIVDYEAMYHLGLYGSGESHPITVTDFGYRHYWVEFDDPTIMRIHDRNQATVYADEAVTRGDRIWFLVSINPFTEATRDGWDPLTDRLADLRWSMTRVETKTSAVLELWEPR